MNTAEKHVLFIVLVAGLSGCALLNKSDPVTPRYFSLDPVTPPADETQTNPQTRAKGELRLRLGRIRGAMHIEERLVYRDTVHEVGYHRDRRWTEPPENFLHRMLARALFETRGIGHDVGGTGPTLDVHLTALDEIRAPPLRVRVQAVAVLHIEKKVVWEETLTEERPIGENDGDDPASGIVAAFAAALVKVVDRIADGAIAGIAAHTAGTD